jgi:hypothetical protein
MKHIPAPPFTMVGEPEPQLTDAQRLLEAFGKANTVQYEMREALARGQEAVRAGNLAAAAMELGTLVHGFDLLQERASKAFRLLHEIMGDEPE